MVEKLNYLEILTVNDDCPDNIKNALEKYFEVFISLKEVTKKSNGIQFCYSCQHELNGFFGSFKWGLVHGEGFCSHCSWPSRAMHYIKDETGSEIGILKNFILQYHPDIVEKETN